VQFPPLHDPRSSDTESELPVPVNTVFWVAAPKLISLGLLSMVINVDVAAAGNAPNANTARTSNGKAIFLFVILPSVVFTSTSRNDNERKNRLRPHEFQPRVSSLKL
jgi:hypothetical protein